MIEDLARSSLFSGVSSPKRVSGLGSFGVGPRAWSPGLGTWERGVPHHIHHQDSHPDATSEPSERGEIDCCERVSIGPQMYRTGGRTIHSLEAEPEFSVLDIAILMIIVSDYTATNLCIDWAGMGEKRWNRVSSKPALRHSGDDQVRPYSHHPQRGVHIGRGAACPPGDGGVGQHQRLRLGVLTFTSY